MEYERNRLQVGERKDLADMVRWVAHEGETPGYDILSYDLDGSERWIEVKATTGKFPSSVIMTENERRKAVSAPKGRYWLYLVADVFKRPQVTMIQDLPDALGWDGEPPTPLTWHVRLRS